MPDYCEICGQETNRFFLLPLKQANGKLETLACLKCALVSSVYCQLHQAIHLIYIDGTTACPKCIDSWAAGEGKFIGNKLLEMVDAEDGNWILFIDWIREVQIIAKETAAVAASRAVVSYALRYNLSPEEVLQMIKDYGPQIVLPPIII